MNVDLFHIGPQKTATTWVYRCLKEHPEIAAPPMDTIHYYDIFYPKGKEWYSKFFEGAGDSNLLYDPTYTYIRSPWAPRRIKHDNPNAKIILCLRNPVERAFSHYWHEKKKGNISFEFAAILDNYDLYSSWLEPGFYAEHIERYLQYFDREQLLCLRFEHLKDDPRGFLKQILCFAGVNDKFEPSWLYRKSNEAGGKQTHVNRFWHRLKGAVAHSDFEAVARNLRLDNIVHSLEDMPLVGTILKDRSEYEAGIPASLCAELFNLCEPEIERLEDVLDINLEAWRQ